ncbi:MAG: hemolysin III family protein [Gammaproteobacteria bacterium]
MGDVYGDTVRVQSLGEELANSLSHGIGLLLAIAAIPILVVAAAAHAGAAEITGVSIFGATMVLAYLSSTLYHALPAGKGKRVMQLVDHGAIFLLIAGTYTPFTLGALWGAWGWSLFGVVWGLALMGLVLKTCVGTRYQSLSVALYLAMGWLVLIAIRPLYLHVPAWGLFWLVLGGLAYTIGVVFFVLDEKVRYAHAVWHLFVLAGTFCHFVAVLWYAA